MITLKHTTLLLAASALCGLPMMAGDTPERVERLNLDTRVASIPEGSDVASIRFEGLKKVEVATSTRSAVDERYCNEEQLREPGGSMYCPYTQTAGTAVAYRVTYSYRGQPLASDEYAIPNHTFSVYFRPEELPDDARAMLTARKISRADTAGYFDVKTYRGTTTKVAIDNAASTFCEGAYIDGEWVHTHSGCQDYVAYTTVTVPSPYITVRIDPSQPRQGQTISAAVTGR
jgi:hypothetical protein